MASSSSSWAASRSVSSACRGVGLSASSRERSPVVGVELELVGGLGVGSAVAARSASGQTLLGLGEALGGGLGQGQQLRGQIAGVVDDPVALDPDPVGVGVEVLDPLLRRGGDLGRLGAGLLEPVLGLARDCAVICSAVSWARWRMPEICSPTRSSARRTAASGERVACSSATSWLVCCT